MDKKTRTVVCTYFAAGKRHDFRLYKDSALRALPRTKLLTDTGYIGITKLHANTVLPLRGSKYHKLTPNDKAFNRSISSVRATNEHVIGSIKRFKILSERYRNRRKRFALRFNLIAGICNYQLLG